MTVHSFSSTVPQFNEAQIEVIKSMGFGSLLIVNLKHRPRKFAKWLVESFDLYAIWFRLPNGQKFQITPFNVNLTFGLLVGGREIIEVGISSSDEENEHVYNAWMQECEIDKKTSKLTQMLDFILAKIDGGVQEKFHHLLSQLLL